MKDCESRCEGNMGCRYLFYQAKEDEERRKRKLRRKHNWEILSMYRYYIDVRDYIDKDLTDELIDIIINKASGRMEDILLGDYLG